MTSTMMVDLVPVDEVVLESLLALAVAEAQPDEVLPCGPGQSAGPRLGWDERRKSEFRAYHRRCQVSLTAPVPEVTWGVRAKGRLVGAARLALVDGAPETREAGLWLGRSYRGYGIVSEVTYWALAAVRTMGAKRLVVPTRARGTVLRRSLERVGFEVVEDSSGLVGTISLP